ncbi:hypothetical protein KCU84_g23856, partial [Aureobasidium melanogenum]
MSRSSTPALPMYNASRQDLAPPDHTRPPLTRLRTPQTVTANHAVLTPQETATRLSTSLTHGLQPNEAATRLHSDGPNELPHEEPEPLWLRFVKQFQETLILLLLASAFISAVMGNLEDAVSIAIAVLIVVTVAFVQEYRSEKSMEALNSLVPHSAHVIRSAERRPDNDTLEEAEKIP